MSKEVEQGAAKAADPQSDLLPGEKEITYHKAPSFLWFVIPFALLLVYGYFSK